MYKIWQLQAAINLNRLFMKNIFLGIAFVFCVSLNAQTILTLEEANRITLENNFGIRIAKNNIQLAENQTDKSVNGYLPTVFANGGLNGSFGGSTQQFNNGLEANTANAITWGASASVNADYTIYDKQRDLTLDQFKENLALSNLQLRQAIEQSVLQVHNSYYQLALQLENLAVLNQSIEISKERLKREAYRLEYGQGSGLDILNAEVDIKRDSVNLLNALMAVENEKRNLNVAMGRGINEQFDIEASTEINANLNLTSLLENAKADNVDMQINRQTLTLNEMDLDIIEAEKKPTLTAGAAYNFNFSDNPSEAFVTQSTSRGFSGNVGVAWTIFDGSRDIRKQNTALNLTNLKLQAAQIEQQLERDITNAWASYQNSIFVLRVEKSAVETNRENFSRTEEQVKVGRLSSLEFRQAQLNLLNAQTSLNNAKLNTKLAEVQLLALVGKLL